MVQSRLRIGQALDAVICRNATDEAYKVIEQSGYRELFPGCIYRDEVYVSIAITTARQIITQAKHDDTYPSPMPDDDATIIKEAETLVEMAEQAWAQNIRGPEVEKILKLAAAGVEDGSDGDSENTDTDDGEVEALDLFSNLPEKLAKMEPYEGYADDRVKDITDAIVWYLEDPSAELDDDEKVQLLQHCWAFEISHKARSRILTFITEAAKRIGGNGEEEEAASDTGGGPESDSGSEEDPISEADAEAGDEMGSEESGEAFEAEGEDDESDADDDTESASSESGSKGSSGKAKSSTQNRGSGSGKGDGPSAYQRLIDIVDKELEAERLDVPSPPIEEIDELPWRWSEISDQALQDFHMQYASLAYFKSYARTRDERIAMKAKEAAEEIKNTMLINADKYDEKGKPRTVTIIEAEIESDDRVKRWRKLQRRHEQFALAAKSEMESYLKLVEALSRLESMRHNAWERGRR